MLNRYPLWVYFLLFIILIFGILYALPNLYGKSFAVQIRYVQGDRINNIDVVNINTILKDKGIVYRYSVVKDHVMSICFFKQEDQLQAYEILLQNLNKKFIVSYSLFSSAPLWLTNIKARPIKLGLDLCGGIHFLMEIDTNTVFNKLYEQYINEFLHDLYDENIFYTKIQKIKNYSHEIYFSNSNVRNVVRLLLANKYKQLLFRNIKNFGLSITLSDEFVSISRRHILQQNIAILRDRISQLGISESLVQTQGVNNIIVELPGIQDIALAKEIIGATVTLEFRLVNSNVKEYFSTDKEYELQDCEIKNTRDGIPCLLYKKVILGGEHIINANYSRDEYNRPQVNIFLDEKGGNIMSQFTKDNIGRLMATLLVEYKDSGKKDADGRVIFVKQEAIINIATIQSQLKNYFCIVGINNSNEARKLSLLLRMGSLRSPMYIVEERTIGPSLGMNNIIKGLYSCCIGLTFSIVFMVVWYKIFGVIAAIILVINLLLIISIISLLPGVTLTMPGIAGILLTLSIAVDANVLINERIKEELNMGKTVQHAIYKGYYKATSSIFDANIITIITSVVLYIVGTGVIKGYVITTIIGITVSMFTSIIGTRAVVNFLYGARDIKKLSI